MKQINQKNGVRLYVCISLMLLTCLITIGYMIIIFNLFPNAFLNDQERLDNLECSLNKQAAYSFCSSFNFMAYLNMEQIRRYSNSSFEYNSLPNCKWFYNNTEVIKLSTMEWLIRTNITHLNSTQIIPLNK